jgi:hypothetical protein
MLEGAEAWEWLVDGVIRCTDLDEFARVRAVNVVERDVVTIAAMSLDLDDSLRAIFGIEQDTE